MFSSLDDGKLVRSDTEARLPFAEKSSTQKNAETAPGPWRGRQSARMTAPATVCKDGAHVHQLPDSRTKRVATGQTLGNAAEAHNTRSLPRGVRILFLISMCVFTKR